MGRNHRIPEIEHLVIIDSRFFRRLLCNAYDSIIISVIGSTFRCWHRNKNRAPSPPCKSTKQTCNIVAELLDRLCFVMPIGTAPALESFLEIENELVRFRLVPAPALSIHVEIALVAPGQVMGSSMNRTVYTRPSRPHVRYPRYS